MPRALRCPREGTPLVAEPHGEVTVDRCPRCRGIWLDKTEVSPVLDAAKEAAGEKPAAGPWEPVRYLACPSCSTQMARRNYLRVSGVIVDTCLRCGTWLDGGELERIGAFLARGGESRAAAAEASLEEEERVTRASIERLGRRSRYRRHQIDSWHDVGDLADLLGELGIFRDGSP